MYIIAIFLAIRIMALWHQLKYEILAQVLQELRSNKKERLVVFEFDNFTMRRKMRTPIFAMAVSLTLLLMPNASAEEIFVDAVIGSKWVASCNRRGF